MTAWGVRKFTQRLWKNGTLKLSSVFFIIKSMHSLFWMCVFSAVSLKDFNFKMLSQPARGMPDYAQCTIAITLQVQGETPIRFLWRWPT